MMKLISKFQTIFTFLSLCFLIPAYAVDAKKNPATKTPAAKSSSNTSSTNSAVTTLKKLADLPSYEKGAGALYKLKLDKDDTEISIAFVDSSPEKAVVEMHFTMPNENPMLQIEMTQQFHLQKVGTEIKLVKGIVEFPQIPTPQILPPEYLQGFSGVQVDSFMVKNEKDLNNKKVGTEKLTINGVQYTADHYRNTENGQTVDFWISEQIKPLGLLKLKSTGNKKDFNYELEFKNTLTGVKAKIDEKLAVPLDDMAKAFLPLLMPSLKPE